jgi:hypothetical protein
MLGRPKHSKNEVVAPKEEKEICILSDSSADMSLQVSPRKSYMH